MIVTEEQAKEIWCPHSLASIRPVEKLNDNILLGFECIAANRLESDNLPTGTRCIASKCMAWRWNIPTSDYPIGFIPQGAHGYCGKDRKSVV